MCVHRVSLFFAYKWFPKIIAGQQQWRLSSNFSGVFSVFNKGRRKFWPAQMGYLKKGEIMVGGALMYILNISVPLGLKILKTA